MALHTLPESNSSESPGFSAEATNKNRDGEEPEASESDIVDWDGPDDPENPMNWSDSKKWLNIAVLSGLSLITYVRHLI